MTPQDVRLWWQERVQKKRPRAGPLAPTEAVLLVEQSGLEAGQLQWAMGAYAEATAYPHSKDFWGWLAGFRVHVPEDLIARAYLHGDPTLAVMAEHLEVLTSSWYPTEETRGAIETLREDIKACLR